MIEVLPPFLVYVICCYALEYKQPKIQRSSYIALSVSNLLLGCITAAVATRFFDLSTFTSIPHELLAFGMMGFIGDTLFYWSHRLLHVPFFFQRYHALHHTHVNPISWTASRGVYHCNDRCVLNSCGMRSRLLGNGLHVLEPCHVFTRDISHGF